MLTSKNISVIFVTIVLDAAILSLLIPLPSMQIASGQDGITEGRLPSLGASEIFSENATAATVQQQNATAATVQQQNATAATVQQQNATAATVQQQLTDTTIADLARQAAVEIASFYFAPASTVGWTIDQELLQQDVEGLVQAGIIDPNDPSQVSTAQSLIFIDDPSRYISETSDVRSIDGIAIFGGSGFVVTPQGHIITNAHVIARADVSPERREEISSSMIDQAALAAAQEDVDQITQITGLNIDIDILSDLQRENLLSALQLFHASRIKIDPGQQGISQRIFVNGIAIPKPAAPDLPGIEARIIEGATGLPFPGRDVGVIKMDITGQTGQNLPTLPLGGNIGTLNTLDDIVIVGFPGAISESPIFTEVTNPVAISAEVGGLYEVLGIITPEGTGWTAIQIGTSLSGGISGGPALDRSGNVIGIATFGIIDPETGGTIPGIGFLVPADVIREFLASANIQPQESRFTAMYRQALEEFHAGNYEEAQNILQDLQAISPNNQDISNYISRTTTAS